MLQACAILGRSRIFLVPRFIAAASASTLRARRNGSTRELPIIKRRAVTGTSICKEAEVVARKDLGMTLIIAMTCSLFAR